MNNFFKLKILLKKIGLGLYGTVPDSKDFWNIMVSTVWISLVHIFYNLPELECYLGLVPYFNVNKEF